MDTNRHKFFMLQLLKDIFSDALLSSVMAFKGGTATMFSTICRDSRQIWTSIFLMRRRRLRSTSASVRLS